MKRRVEPRAGVLLGLIVSVVLASLICLDKSFGQSEILPKLVLTIPDKDQHKAYLGLSGKSGGSFRFEDIQAFMH